MKLHRNFDQGHQRREPGRCSEEPWPQSGFGRSLKSWNHSPLDRRWSEGNPPMNAWIFSPASFRFATNLITTMDPICSGCRLLTKTQGKLYSRHVPRLWMKMPSILNSIFQQRRHFCRSPTVCLLGCLMWGSKVGEKWITKGEIACPANINGVLFWFHPDPMMVDPKFLSGSLSLCSVDSSDFFLNSGLPGQHGRVGGGRFQWCRVVETWIGGGKRNSYRNRKTLRVWKAFLCIFPTTFFSFHVDHVDF